MTLSRKDAAELFARHGLRPSRALGQNFVVDPNTVRRIARLAGVGPADRVVEIGAGLGSLTLALLETGAAVTAVEIDRYVLPALREAVEPKGAVVVHGDAMTLDWTALLGPVGVGNRWVMVANLPYNIATPLVCDLLDGVGQIDRMLVMVQKEVGDRLAAPVRTAAYGAVSVKVAYWATAAVIGTVPPTVFVPQPNVDSALVRIDRRSVPAVDPALVAPAELFQLVRQAFGQRRKMLRRSLAGRVTDEQFLAAGVRPDARPEELDVGAWGRLATAAPVPAPARAR